MYKGYVRTLSPTHSCCVIRIIISIISACLFSCLRYKNVKWSRYRPGVAQRVGRVIALLFHDRGTRRGWVVSSTPQPHFTTGKDPLPILQEAGWAPGPVWTGGKSRPHRDSIPDRPARSRSLYGLSYPHAFVIRHTNPKFSAQHYTVFCGLSGSTIFSSTTSKRYD